MSIKKLFGSVENSRNYLSETNQKNVFKDIESTDNLQQLSLKVYKISIIYKNLYDIQFNN